MTLRRRLALLIDPTIALIRPEPPSIDLYRGLSWEMAHSLDAIAKSLASLDQKTRKRRPRIVECQHPELHPELELVS